MYFNRTATTNGPISLVYAAGLGKYGYGNGIAVTERISGTVLLSQQPCLTKVTRNSGVYFRAFIRTKADVKRRYYVHMSKSY